jgi:hypothetical protein
MGNAVSCFPLSQEPVLTVHQVAVPVGGPVTTVENVSSAQPAAGSEKKAAQ